MRAVLCREWGPIDGLTIADVPSPKPGAGDVLIDVKATAVNYADAIMVAGQYQTKPPLPFSPGLETAGVVAACGPGVADDDHGGSRGQFVQYRLGRVWLHEVRIPEKDAARQRGHVAEHRIQI